MMVVIYCLFNVRHVQRRWKVVAPLNVKTRYYFLPSGEKNYVKGLIVGNIFLINQEID